MCGTNQKSLYSPQEHKRLKYWQPFATTARNNQSVLPDLSEIHIDEELIWEEILQIRQMPITMQKKKELKTDLQNATKLRLVGLNQLKWKQRKAWQKIVFKLSRLFTNLKLWQTSLHQIEQQQGTGIAAYFRFLRWLFCLNCVTFLVIFVFLIIPNMINYYDKDKVQQCDSKQNISNCIRANSDKFLVADVLLDLSNLEKSLIFYGAYSNKKIGWKKENTNGIQYDLPLAYIFVLLTYFLLTLIIIIKSAKHDFKERLIIGQWQCYEYCNLLFAGWDFCVDNKKSLTVKNKAVYNEVKGLIECNRLGRAKNNRSNEYIFKVILLRIIVNIIVFLILIMSAYYIFVIFDFCLKQKNLFNFHTMSQEKIKETNNQTHELNKTDTNTLQFDMEYVKVKQFIREFLPYIFIAILNLFVPLIFNYLCSFEKYSPLVAIKVNLFRRVFLRLASFGVVLSQLYNYEDKSQTYKLISDGFICPETYAGKQFLNIIVADFMCLVIITFLVNFPRAFFARNCNYKYIKLFGQQEFELSKHVLDVVYSQMICWLGCIYCPFLPLFVTFTTYNLFYVNKFQCLINSISSKKLYRASKSNVMFMLICLMSFLFALIPFTYIFFEISPSSDCGPFKGFKYIWKLPVDVFNDMPNDLKNFIQFFGTATFLIPCFLFLILLSYYFNIVSGANKNMVTVLKSQLILEGHDKQFLLNRLSFFLKQYQEIQE